MLLIVSICEIAESSLGIVDSMGVGVRFWGAEGLGSWIRQFSEAGWDLNGSNSVAKLGSSTKKSSSSETIT